MNTELIVLMIGAGWLLIGLVLALAMGRRGHSAFSWGLMGALLGPFALVLATEAVRDERNAGRTVLDAGVPRHQAGASVLAGIDGSAHAAAALDAALAM